MEQDTHELAWGAGFTDGEAWFGIHKLRGYWRPLVVINQVDRQVLDRFAAAVGGGGVYGPYPPRRGNQQPIWKYQADSLSARRAAAVLGPWLGQVKLEQIDRGRVRAADRNALLGGPGPLAWNRHRTHCPQGHPYDEANTYRKQRGKYVERHCRTCRRDRDRGRKRGSRNPRSRCEL